MLPRAAPAVLVDSAEEAPKPKSEDTAEGSGMLGSLQVLLGLSPTALLLLAVGGAVLLELLLFPLPLLLC